MPDYVEFVQGANATPDGGTRVATLFLNGMEYQLIALASNDGNPVNVQNPVPTDGDSVYTKDVWIDESDIGDFSGSINDLFNNLHSVCTNSTATNPKLLFIHFNRTIVSNAIGLGCYGGG